MCDEQEEEEEEEVHETALKMDGLTRWQKWFCSYYRLAVLL